MTIYDTLKSAIELHHCVRIRAGGLWRDICPVALGVKNSEQKLLAFQYAGDSASGITPEGAWRCFPLGDITAAAMIGDPWHSGEHPVWKTEASLDYVVCGPDARRRLYDHLKRAKH